MLLVTPTNPGAVWKDTAQRCDSKEARIPGGHLGTGHHWSQED